MDNVSDPEAHIAAWEAAGLIDASLASRLRAAPGAETTPTTAASTPVESAATPSRPAGAASALFGPGVSIGEMFGYIGGAFLLGAWTAFIARSAAQAHDPRLTTGIGLLTAAVVLVALGAWLGRGPDRFRRGAGVAFVVATGAVGGGVVALLASATGDSNDLVMVSGAGAALAVAMAFRSYLPAVVTHLGVLAAATTLVSTILGWLHAWLAPEPFYRYGLDPSASLRTGVDPLLLAVGQAACWAIAALVIGFIGLREARSDTPAAGRRAAVSRAWAGTTLVVGIASALNATAYAGGYEWHRVLEPWIAAAVVLIACVVLVERAFRREASAFVYPAALGLIIAATDLNITYLSDSIEVGLLIEGGVLLAAGVVADRLRRRIGAPPRAVAGGPAIP